MIKRLRSSLAGAVLALALAAPAAFAEEAPIEGTSASQTAAPAPTPATPVPPPTTSGGVIEGESLVAPKPKPETPGESGGVTAKPKPAQPKPQAPTVTEQSEDGSTSAPAPPSDIFTIPSLPSPSCSPGAVPPVLIPIYQRAAQAYKLGPQGASILAAINLIETAFGTNLNISSAGAVGWMQFMPPTWEAYGVDANGDGVRDPYDPEDAIFSAANYLKASGMPADTYGAIYAYNHADWYVADVLANARCFAQLGAAAASPFSLTPKLTVLECDVPKPWRKEIPVAYLNAFEGAAARYGLGKRGVWALAAVTRLESDFGRGMTKADMKERGPLGLDPTEWKRFAVDGDGDGRVRHADPDDSAATLARLIWSRGGLRAGLFTHNQAEWYVEAVMGEADRIAGTCRASEVEWALALPNVVMAPLNWENLSITNQVAREDLEQGRIDPRIVGLIGAMTQRHQIVLSSLRSDHSMNTVSGGVSNHYYGRAMDIASVDGISCTDTSPSAPCAELAVTLASLPSPAMPTELIYCFDVDGPGPAFARSDHCDHIHAGYDY